MRKKILAVMVVLLLAAGSASAQLSLGGTGAVFASADQSLESIVDLFKDGEGIFYGPFLEFGMNRIAFGVAFNWSYYSTTYGETVTKMVDYDLNGYLQGHLLSYKSFLDPFVEVGFGQIATDYAEDDPDSSAPLRATKYFQVGGGLGVNLGNLGVFAKALYMVPADEPVLANSGGYSYSLEEYPLKPLKFFVGAKVIL
ncbi:MAG TPA: hypothetical protein VN445_00075 [Rectinemataceae bacterium]|nr:hypothetical protein [Rectinemataceae bacterium]